MAARPVSIHFVCGETRRPAGNCFATPVLVGRDATAAIVVNEMRETAVLLPQPLHLGACLRLQNVRELPW